MRTIKYLLIGALVTVTGTPAVAQTDAQSAVASVASILKSGAADKDKQIATIAKAFKKDAKTLTAIGQEYLNVDNIAKAEEYGKMAIAKSKNFGNAYILLGDAAVKNDDSSAAGEWYQQAMYMDKTNPEGYRRYAYLMRKVSPQASADALEQLRSNVPGYPVDIIAAEIYDRAGELDKAITYYERVDKDKMKVSELANYAGDLFFTQKYDKCLETSLWGLNKFPRNASLARLAFYSYTETKDYGSALKFADRLFNASDSAKISTFDYQYYGHAYKGAGDYDNAIAQFKTILTRDDANKQAKEDALKNIADSYKEKEDWPNAIDAYKKYLDVATNATANDYAGLGTIYLLMAQEQTGQQQKTTIAEGDQIFSNLGKKFPDAAEYAEYQRARLAGIADPQSKDGLAKPHYDKLIDIITASGNIEGVSKTRLIQAYHYNMSYSLITKNNTAEAKEYAAKILAIDPDHTQAKQVSALK